MDTNSDKTKVNIRPTLIIGLGGTGARIAVELKARLEESFGGSGNYHKAVRFVCFDTANENFFTYQPNYPNRRVDLIPEQELIRISDVPLHDLIQSRETNPAIAAVLPEILHSTHIDQGAQQVRRLGRIALIYHYSRVKQKLTDAINDLRHIHVSGKLGETPTHEIHIPESPRLRVYIICSICGGTGSGTFLDMAYLVRHFAAAPIDVVGMLLLPEAFPEIVTTGYARIRANAYAALSDLEYYNQPTVAGQSLYRISLYEEDVRVDGPPFSLCYLAGHASTAGTVGGMADLAPILADSLQAMISSRIGEQLDATLDNIRGSLRRYHNGYRAFYSAIGIARIVYPLAWLRREFSRRLKHTLISDYVLAEPDVNDGLRQNAANWYGSTGSNGAIGGGQREEMRRSLREQLTGENQITRRLDNLRSDVATRNDLVSELQYAFRDAFNQHKLQVVPQVKDNRTRTRNRMFDELQAHLYRLIDGDEGRGGLVRARAWLRELDELVRIDMGEIGQRQRIGDPDNVLYEHMTHIDEALTIPLAGQMLAQSRTRRACLELAQLFNRSLRDSAVDEVLHDLLADLQHRIDSYIQTINRAIDQWQNTLISSDMMEDEPNYAPTTLSIVGKDDIEQHLRETLEAAIHRGQSDADSDANLASSASSASQVSTIQRGLQVEWRKLAANRKGLAHHQDSTTGLALALELGSHQAMVEILDAFCDAQYASSARTNVAERIIDDPATIADTLNRLGEYAQPLLVYSEGKLQAQRPREIKVLGAKTKQQAEEVKPNVQAVGGDVSVVGTGEETELTLLVTYHGIPFVTLNHFKEYRDHYVQLRRDRMNIMHLSRELEQSPYDPGSLYFVNLESFEAYLARALGYRWIIRGETMGEKYKTPVFGLTETFQATFARVLEDTLTRMQNKQTVTAMERDRAALGSYEYVRSDEQFKYLTAQIDVLKAVKANMVDSNRVMLTDSGKPDDAFVLHVPRGGIVEGKQITDTWQPASTLFDVNDAFIGGDSRSRVIPELFMLACDEMGRRTPNSQNNGHDGIKPMREFLRLRGYKEDIAYMDGSATEPLEPQWATPGQPEYDFERHLTALLVVEFRMKLSSRYNNRRIPPGYHLEKDADIMIPPHDTEQEQHS